MEIVIDKNKCDSCGTCVKTCPTNTIKLVKGKPKVNNESCILCALCKEFCPKKAIELK